MYLRFAPDFQIRLLFLAALGRAFSFDPPPNPRLGGDFSRDAETNRVSGPLVHESIKSPFYFVVVLRTVEKTSD